jgi:hypothetical protein
MYVAVRLRRKWHYYLQLSVTFSVFLNCTQACYYSVEKIRLPIVATIGSLPQTF